MLERIKSLIIKDKYYIFTVSIMIIILIIGLFVSTYRINEIVSVIDIIRIILGLIFTWGMYIIGYFKFVKNRPVEYNLEIPYSKSFYKRLSMWFMIIFDVFAFILFTISAIIWRQPLTFFMGLLSLVILIGIEFIIFKFLKVINR